MLNKLFEFLGLRKPSKTDKKMAHLEMDYYLRGEGFVPYRSSKRLKRRRRKKKDEPEVQVVASSGFIEGKEEKDERNRRENT
jgi:5-methylcytosine-specific restriction endonuclease McrA